MELSGKFELSVKRDGKVIHRDSGRNLITTVGENLVATYITDSPGDMLSHMALGSDATFPLKSNTTLETEIAGTRTADLSNVTAANIVTWTFSFTAADTITVKEVGIFNHATVGTMIARFLTQTFEMNSGDVLVMAWSLTISGID